MHGEPHDWLWRASTWRNALIALAVSIALMAGFSLWAAHLHDVLAAAQLPDLARIGAPKRLPADSIAARLDSLSPAGRAYYHDSTLTLDLLFPVAYALMFSFAIGALLRAPGIAGAVQLLRFVPFAAALADYAENTFIVLFSAGRITSAEASHGLAVLTPAKWWLIYASAAIVVLLGSFWIARRWSTRKPR